MLSVRYVLRFDIFIHFLLPDSIESLALVAGWVFWYGQCRKGKVFDGQPCVASFLEGSSHVFSYFLRRFYEDVRLSWIGAQS
jgi:hypothetical protein